MWDTTRSVGCGEKDKGPEEMRPLLVRNCGLMRWIDCASTQEGARLLERVVSGL